MFHGSIVALATPMDTKGAIDESTLRESIERHISEGTNAIVVNGTTGEASTLTKEEQRKIIKIAVEVSDDRIPIIAGTGTNNTTETIHITNDALDLGVDACLIVTPYYNKPTQEGLFQHYESVAKSVPIPILLYNVPSRTGVDMQPETVGRLSKISNIIGIKEATGDLKRVKEILNLSDDNIDLYSGDDASALMFMLQGGSGVISVTANVAPKTMSEMCQAALNGNIDLAGEINTRLMPLHKNLFIESNPIPVKWVLQEMGLIQKGIRLPLTQLSEKYHSILKDAMETSGVI